MDDIVISTPGGEVGVSIFAQSDSDENQAKTNVLCRAIVSGDEAKMLEIAADPERCRVVNGRWSTMRAKYYKFRPLCIAAYEGRPAFVRRLLAAKALIDLGGEPHYDATPLYVASQLGHKQVVQVLVESKASVNKADNIGATPLWQAARQGRRHHVRGG